MDREKYLTHPSFKGIEPFKNKIWLSSPTMHGEEQKWVDEAIRTNWVSTVGANINEVERMTAEKVGCKYAVALSSGTASLHLAVKLAGERLYGQPKIGHGTLEGKRVFCSDMTFDATVNPICYESGIPVFIDTEADTWNIGTDNVLTAAIEDGVECVICLSTDKAAYPINSMGMTKAIEEKVAIAKSRMSGKTKICCTRYGNVMCSRGSVIPLWIDQIKAGNPITVTEPNMTRFIMSLEEAVDLVLFAFEHGENGDLLIKKAPACTIQTQAEAVCELFGGKKEDIKVIGIRHGEKMYETLLTNEECAKAVDMGDFYRVPADNRGLNYDKYFKEGDEARNTLTEFNSNNTRRLNLQETIDTIAKLEYIQGRLAEDK